MTRRYDDGASALAVRRHEEGQSPVASARQRPTPARRQASKQEPPRQSQAYHRRQELARAEREQRRITIGALAVLAVVALLLVGGYLYADYLPRHAQLLAVGNQKFDADTVAHRGFFYTLLGDNDIRQNMGRNPAATTLDALAREETLLQAGASQVDAISDSDIGAAMRKRVSLAPEVPQAQLDQTVNDRLKDVPVARSVFEQSVRATAIADKFTAKLRATVPSEGPQMHLLYAQSATKSEVERLAATVAGGADFSVAAVQAGFARSNDKLDIGWVPVDIMAKAVREATASVQPGKTSAIVQVPNGDWAMYQVVERADKRTYDEGEKDSLADTNLNDWIEAQRDALHVQRNLKPSNEQWVQKQLQNLARDYQAAQARRSATPQ